MNNVCCEYKVVPAPLDRDTAAQWHQTRNLSRVQIWQYRFCLKILHNRKVELLHSQRSATFFVGKIFPSVQVYDTHGYVLSTAQISRFYHQNRKNTTLAKSVRYVSKIKDSWINLAETNHMQFVPVRVLFNRIDWQPS